MMSAIHAAVGEALSVDLSITTDALLVEGLRAEYIHPDLGLVVIEGSLPPPPPSQPALAAGYVDPATVETVATTVSAVVAGALAAAPLPHFQFVRVVSLSGMEMS